MVGLLFKEMVRYHPPPFTPPPRHISYLSSLTPGPAIVEGRMCPFWLQKNRVCLSNKITLISDELWCGYLFHGYTFIGQRMEWVSFQWVHWYWTENEVSVFSIITLILDGVGILPLSILILEGVWIFAWSTCTLILDREWSGYPSFEYYYDWCQPWL